MGRVVAVAFLLALVGTGCSGDGEPGETSTPSSAPPPAELPFRAADGALRGISLTSSFDPDAPVEPRLGFTTEDTSVTAIVDVVDGDAGSSLTVTWHRLVGTEDGETLFSHDIAVADPSGTATSQGVSPTGLAPGVYEVVATLGDAEVSMPWSVEVATGASLGMTTLGMSTMSLAQVGDEDWNAPSAGDAEWYASPEPTGTPAPPGPCQLVSLIPSFDPRRDVNARAGWIGTCTHAELRASMSGAPTTLASLDVTPGQGIPQIHASADVCELPGGSDLPGAVVRWTAVASDGQSLEEDLALPDLGETLEALIQSVPEPGVVEPGTRIALRGMAVVLPPALGVASLEILVDGSPIERVGNASETTSPEPCDDGRYGAIAFAHHDVPQGASGTIHICAHAVGFDGSEDEHCIDFSSGDATWEGTIVSRNTGANCEGGEEGTITLEVSGGEVVGSFEASGSYTCEGITVQTGGSVKLSGRLDAEGFTLTYGAVEGSPASSLVCFVGSPFVLPVEGDTAGKRFEVTAPSGDHYRCDVEAHPVTASA